MHFRVSSICSSALFVAFFLMFFFFSPATATASSLEISAENQVPGQANDKDMADGTVVSLEEITRTDSYIEWKIIYMSDGLKVTGFLFEPVEEGADPVEKAVKPAIVFNHGGVGGVSEVTKMRCRQLAEAGYITLAPSFRGEGGSEGEIEVAAGEVDDVLNAVKLLRAMPDVNPDKIGMGGTSHGGIITLLAIQRDPNIAAALCAYGVTNTFTWYKYLVDNGFDVSDDLSIKVYGHGPEDKPEAFRSRAPALDAHLVKTPLLMLYGENDSIVPPSQGLEMAAALDKYKIPYVLKIIPGVGHGFLYYSNPKLRSDKEIAKATEIWEYAIAFFNSNLK